MTERNLPGLNLEREIASLKTRLEVISNLGRMADPLSLEICGRNLTEFASDVDNVADTFCDIASQPLATDEII